MTDTQPEVKKRFCMPEPREDLTDRIIMEQIPAESRVVDLGCGDGRLLELLQRKLSCDVLGVELDLDEIQAAIGRGVPVVQADLDEQLAELPDQAFDFAVLSQTLQQVRHPRELLSEMLRVAHRAIVVVPNFAHWRVRFEIFWKGRAPMTASLPYNWFDTPNQRFMSLHDFRDLARSMNCEILEEFLIIGTKAVPKAFAANLRAENVLYVLECKENAAC